MSELMLKGRRALVTGSVQGIGLAIAQALGRQGCAVVLHGLATPAQVQEARAAVLEAGAPSADVLTHDLRIASQVQRMMETVLASPLDILVNNAGIQHTASLAEMPRAKWDEILAVNLSAAFDTMRLALPPYGRARLRPCRQHRLGSRLGSLHQQGAVRGGQVRADRHEPGGRARIRQPG